MKIWNALLCEFPALKKILEREPQTGNARKLEFPIIRKIAEPSVDQFVRLSTAS
jgi:hypothetical protein